jgi:hypothetical protein
MAETCTMAAGQGSADALGVQCQPSHRLSSSVTPSQCLKQDHVFADAQSLTRLVSVVTVADSFGNIQSL